MANATWLDSGSLEADSDDDENETWHVVIAPGEVKTLTLEQLDDFYRLDVIGVSTQVWGPDMRGWTTLGEALGITQDDEADDDEISVVAEDMVVSPNDKLTPRAAASWPPAGFERVGPKLVAVPEEESHPRGPAPKLMPYGSIPVDPYQSEIPTVARAYIPPAPRLQAIVPPPPPKAPPAPPVNVARQTKPFGVAPTLSPFGVVTAPSAPPPPINSPGSTMPWGGAPAYEPLPRSVAPRSAEVYSLRPAAVDVYPRRDSIRAFASDPDIYVQKSSNFGAWLMVAALFAGGLVTAYRNDLIRDAAHRAGQDAAYSRLEAALGGPAFGTPRSLEHQKADTMDTGTALGARSYPLDTAKDTTTQVATKTTDAAAVASKADAPKTETAARADAKTDKPTTADHAVSLDALPSEPPEAAEAPAKVAPKVEPVKPAPVAVAVAPKTAAKPEPPPKTNKASMMAAFAANKTAKAAPEPAPEPKAEPKPIAAKSKAKPEADEPLPGMPMSLDEAIRDRMAHPSKKPSKQAAPAETPAPKKKKKSGGSEYDPLNSDL